MENEITETVNETPKIDTSKAPVEQAPPEDDVVLETENTIQSIKSKPEEALKAAAEQDMDK